MDTAVRSESPPSEPANFSRSGPRRRQLTRRPLLAAAAVAIAALVAFAPTVADYFDNLFTDGYPAGNEALVAQFPGELREVLSVSHRNNCHEICLVSDNMTTTTIELRLATGGRTREDVMRSFEAAGWQRVTPWGPPGGCRDTSPEWCGETSYGDFHLGRATLTVDLHRWADGEAIATVDARAWGRPPEAD